METTIRRAGVQDTDPLIDLSRRTIRASYSQFLGDEAVESFLTSGAADAYVRDCFDRCAVVEGGGQLLGFEVWRDNLIDLMMIDHRFHRHGVGTQLLVWVEKMLGRTHDELRAREPRGQPARQRLQ